MDSNNFGSRLREARKSAKLTQKKLADKINAKHNSISDWENNKNKPDPDTIELICGVLGISPNYLLGNTEESISPSEISLIKKYRFLSSHGKNLVDTLITTQYEYEKNLLSFSDQTKESSAAYAENITVLPTLVQRICAGTGSIGDDVLQEEGQYPAISVPDGSQYAAVITGNSMEPEFYDGDIVFYKKVDSLNYGDIGIFNLNDENIIKKYEKTGLHAINPEYDDVIPASDDHVVIIGKVLGKM